MEPKDVSVVCPSREDRGNELPIRNPLGVPRQPFAICCHDASTSEESAHATRAQFLLIRMPKRATAGLGYDKNASPRTLRFTRAAGFRLRRRAAASRVTSRLASISSREKTLHSCLLVAVAVVRRSFTVAMCERRARPSFDHLADWVDRSFEMSSRETFARGDGPSPVEHRNPIDLGAWDVSRECDRGDGHTLVARRPGTALRVDRLLIQTFGIGRRRSFPARSASWTRLRLRVDAAFDPVFDSQRLTHSTDADVLWLCVPDPYTRDDVLTSARASFVSEQRSSIDCYLCDLFRAVLVTEHIETLSACGDPMCFGRARTRSSKVRRYRNGNRDDSTVGRVVGEQFSSRSIRRTHPRTESRGDERREIQLPTSAVTNTAEVPS